MSGAPTIDFPAAHPLAADVFRPMQSLCKVRGTAADGNLIAKVVYGQISANDLGAVTPTFSPAGLPSCQPNPATGAYNLDNKLFPGCSDAGLTKWLRIIAQYPPPAGVMFPPRLESTSQKILAKCCDPCPAFEAIAPIIATFRRPSWTRSSAWGTFSHLAVNSFPSGTPILDAQTPDDIATAGNLTRRVKVYAFDVDWTFDSNAPASRIFSSAGSGVSDVTFWLPGAPQYSVVLWQPESFDRPAIFRVITATNRRKAQVLEFDRRMPVYAQVNDFIGDFYATNQGEFSLGVKLLS